jgi:hypothetical protein
MIVKIKMINRIKHEKGITWMYRIKFIKIIFFL